MMEFNFTVEIEGERYVLTPILRWYAPTDYYGPPILQQKVYPLKKYLAREFDDFEWVDIKTEA